MRILIVSYGFLPLVGGVERTTEFLALGFSSLGHEVVVLTATRANASLDRERPYAVLRRPRPYDMLKIYSWAEVVLHNTVSLRFIWPHLLVRRAAIGVVHIWIAGDGGVRRLRDRIKLWTLSRMSVQISVSPAIADHLPIRSRVIGNSFDSNTFRKLDAVQRDANLVTFVGRLLADKGISDLIAAVDLLTASGVSVRLRIIGEGPFRDEAEKLAQVQIACGVIEFAGLRTGDELNVLLNESAVLVVPSRWEEPFGIVALEGLAAGCTVVATRSGGLPFALGDAGVYARKADPCDLSKAIRRALFDEEVRAAAADASGRQLVRFARGAVLASYEAALSDARRISAKSWQP